MKSRIPIASALAALPGLFVGAQISVASTFWTGPATNFTQSATVSTDVLIPGAVSLTRAGNQWLFNPAAGDLAAGDNTPTDTEWAFGTIANFSALSYAPFASYRNGDLSQVLVGNPMVLHLIHEDIYISVTFSAWPQHGGFFAYTRSTPAAVAPGPSITITNPPTNTVFSAPANVKISAAATVSSGTITNVAFRTNGVIFASVKASPFSVVASNLSAGSYALTAIATASGVSATSAVVNISVVAPVSVSASLPQVTNGVFGFNFSATPGLSYVVQSSSNFANWISLVTNLAAGNSVRFSEPAAPVGGRFYRVEQLPNP
jgi:hypothetical protein